MVDIDKCIGLTEEIKTRFKCLMVLETRIESNRKKTNYVETENERFDLLYDIDSDMRRESIEKEEIDRCIKKLYVLNAGLGMERDTKRIREIHEVSRMEREKRSKDGD